MIAKGRTMQAAIEAGNYYGIEIPGWSGLYNPPACETIEEVLQCAVSRWIRATPGTVVKGYRILDCSIGAMHVQYLGEFVLPEVAS